MYDNTECVVVISSQLKSRVEIKVRSERLLSPILFGLFLEFVTADLKILCKEFMLDTNLSFDIRYADDTTIMSIVFEKLQLSTEELRAACRKCLRSYNSQLKNYKLPVGNV